MTLRPFLLLAIRPLLLPRSLPLRPLSTSLPLSKFSDPFPLPLSDPDLAALASRWPRPQHSGISQDESDMPQPLDRTGEDEKTMRARLVYQTRKRGTLETDLLLSTFARDHLAGMGMEELKEFDKLLDEPDWDIYYWSVKKKEPPARFKNTVLLQRLQKHARNEGKVVRMMPELMQHQPESVKP